MEMISVVDESHALMRMRFANSYAANGADELMWVNAPTRGMVSNHGYYITKNGAVPATADIDEASKLAFKVTGTTTYKSARGMMTVFVLTPIQ